MEAGDKAVTYLCSQDPAQRRCSGTPTLSLLSVVSHAILSVRRQTTHRRLMPQLAVTRDYRAESKSREEDDARQTEGVPKAHVLKALLGGGGAFRG
jgi:hypothetical protein